MPMLLDRSGETPERWTLLAEDAALPDTGAVIVPLERLDEALATGLRIGLTLPNDAGLEPLRPRFDRLALIRVEFPSFADGRGFSVARRLRDLGFGGELRASGPVIADQYAYLRACGFSTVETPEKIDIRQPQGQWDAAATAMSLGYQRGYGGVRNVFEARRLARTA